MVVVVVVVVEPVQHWLNNACLRCSLPSFFSRCFDVARLPTVLSWWVFLLVVVVVVVVVVVLVVVVTAVLFSFPHHYSYLAIGAIIWV